MNNHNLMPLVEGGFDSPFETLGTSIGVEYLPTLKNYAQDEGVLSFIMNELAPTIDWTRNDRAWLETEWENVRSMNMMKHDDGRRYFGRSDSYLPLYRKTRGTLISSLSQGLFPSDDYFDVVDRKSGDPEKSKPTKLYLQWELERNSKMRSRIKGFLGGLVDYGTSVNKTWYRHQIRSEGGVKRLIPSRLFAGKSTPEYGFKNCLYEGAAVSARNLQYWYIYPTTVDDVEEATLIFEDIDVPHSYMLAMKDAGTWENVPEVLSFWEKVEHARAMGVMLDTRGGFGVPGRDLGEYARRFTITEAWTFCVLPKDAYIEGEDPRAPVPVRIVLVDNIPLEVRRNPFYHQRPPYQVARVDPEPGFFYGSAQGQTVRPLQLLANDFVNQVNDNGIYAMNPIPLVNMGLMAAPPPSLAPGVPWYVQDVNEAVRFERPPFDQVGMGLQMVDRAIRMAQDFGGTPPVIQGVGGEKTATSTQILQHNAKAPIQDGVLDIEIDVMVPMLMQMWKNAVQYRDQKVMVAVAGQQITVTPEDLAIDADVRYLASSQAMNNQVRSQQALSLIQAVAPVVPMLMQMGYIVDFSALIKKVYVDGFGFRGFDEFIRKAEAAPGAMPGAPVRPDQMGGVQNEQQDRLRSALEQINGVGSVEAAPGEAEEFANVRQGADEMAAMQGGQGGLIDGA